MQARGWRRVVARSALTTLAATFALTGSACHTARAPASDARTALALDAGPAAYVAVHVDHLQDGKLREFVAARTRWLRVLAAKGATDGRGLFVQTGDGGFLSLRPLTSFARLDAFPSLARTALADVSRADLEAYDAASDALLAPPHRSELWRFDPSLSYGVRDPMAALREAAWGKMTIEELDPTPAGDDYVAAWKGVREALELDKYPLVRVSFWSQYGSGALVTFWLAKSQAEFLRVRPVEAVLEAALGVEAAKVLVERMRRQVRASDSVDVTPRLDLSSVAL